MVLERQQRTSRLQGVRHNHRQCLSSFCVRAGNSSRKHKGEPIHAKLRLSSAASGRPPET
jgi:hypothetical protein